MRACRAPAPKYGSGSSFQGRYSAESLVPRIASDAVKPLILRLLLCFAALAIRAYARSAPTVSQAEAIERLVKEGSIEDLRLYLATPGVGVNYRGSPVKQGISN